MVTGQAGTLFFCGPHSTAAFQKAMVIAGTEGTCRLFFPPVGDLTITCDAHPAAAPPRSLLNKAQIRPIAFISSQVKALWSDRKGCYSAVS